MSDQLQPGRPSRQELIKEYKRAVADFISTVPLPADYTEEIDAQRKSPNLIKINEGVLLAVYAIVGHVTDELERLRAEVDDWKHKHFDDVMAAKKSGYEDGRADLTAKLDRLREDLRIARGELTPAERYQQDFLDGTFERRQDNA